MDENQISTEDDLEEIKSSFQVVQYPAATLAEEMPKFDFDNPSIDPVELMTILATKMLEEDAIGLAANQLGLPYRAFVIKANPLICCFNPIVVDYGEETELLDEGCLSFKGEHVKVRRPRRIKVRYTEPNGNVVTEKFIDLTARIFLHELDHLNGVTMVDRATMLERERFRKRRKKLARTKK